MASARHRSNIISSIKDGDGNTADTQEDIENIFLRFFRNKWSGGEVELNNWPFERNLHGVDEATHGLLEAEVVDTEIWNAVRDIGVNRAPVIDGLTASFYKNL